MLQHDRKTSIFCTVLLHFTRKTQQNVLGVHHWLECFTPPLLLAGYSLRLFASLSLSASTFCCCILFFSKCIKGGEYKI